MLLDPRRFHSGETVTWSLSPSTFSQATQDILEEDGASIQLGIANAGGAAVVEGALTDGEWVFALDAATSAALAAGAYRYQLIALVTSGETVTKRRVEEAGDLEVLALADGSVAVDARSRWRKIVDDLEAAYADYVATGAMRASYSIDGRSVSFTSHTEIGEAIDRARAQYLRERQRAGIRKAPKIHSRFRI